MAIGMNKRAIAVSTWFLLLIIGLVMLIIDSDGHLNVLLLLTCLVFVFEIIYILKRLQGRVFFLCFLLAFFTLLLGGEILDRYFHIFSATFTPEINKHTDICLLLSLISLFIGYYTAEHSKIRIRIIPFRSGKDENDDYEGVYSLTVRKVSKWLFLATYLVWILVLWRRVSYVQQHGYNEYYLHYSSGLPVIVHKIANVAPVAFYVFLASMPSKKEIKLPLVLYLIQCLLSLGTGRRLYLMLGLLVIVAYLVVRNKYHSNGEVWFSKKMGIALVIAVPFLLGAMYLFEYARAALYVGTASQYNPLFGFFARQGISVNVIKYAERFKEGLNQDAVYSLRNTSSFLHNNALNKYLFHFDTGYRSGAQTVENAIESNYLANYISYRVSSSRYLAGVGIGSCYIAELFVDFGYPGVIVGNLIYGYLLQALYERALKKKSIWGFATGLFIAEYLFSANRSTFDAFFAEPLYLTFWGTLLFIHICGKHGVKRARSSLLYNAGGWKLNR